MINETIENKSQSDEIDLVELIKVLWDKKWWIVLSTFVCTTLAGVYAFTAKEQWTSKAEVVKPMAEDLGSYFSIRKEYARILGQEFDIESSFNVIYDKFILYLNSLDERERFFLKSNYYQNIVAGKDDKQKLEFLNEILINDVKVIKPDSKKNPKQLGVTVQFTAEDQVSAQRVLSEYLNYINKYTYALEIKDFLIYFNELIKDLKYEQSKFERDLNIQRNIKLENLSNAVEVAKVAGIKEYSKPLDSNNNIVQNIALSDTKIPLSDSKLSDSPYLFMLGEKYLQAQFDVIDKSNIVYPPRYYEIRFLLSELEPLLEKAQNEDVMVFRYLSSPSVPVTQDWPKRLIILLIGAILGCFLSIVVILFKRVLVKNEKY